MKKYTEWLPEVRVAVAGADDTLIQQQIAATIREFFTRSTWVEKLFPITLKDGQDRYFFNNMASYYAMYLMMAKIDDTPIYIYPQEPIIYSNKTGVWMDGVNDQVVVTPVPTEAAVGSKLYLEASIKPKNNCGQVPDRVFEMFFDEILDGIKGRLYSMPSKPWSDRQMGLMHTRKFRSGIARARTAERTGYSSADTAWRYPGWA